MTESRGAGCVGWGVWVCEWSGVSPKTVLTQTVLSPKMDRRGTRVQANRVRFPDAGDFRYADILRRARVMTTPGVSRAPEPPDVDLTQPTTFDLEYQCYGGVVLAG